MSCLLSDAPPSAGRAHTPPRAGETEPGRRSEVDGSDRRMRTDRRPAATAFNEHRTFGLAAGAQQSHSMFQSALLRETRAIAIYALFHVPKNHSKTSSEPTACRASASLARVSQISDDDG